MAYTKRTWLGRQGTGLNKFSIGGATPVTIVNQPDSVTQVGDALSAGNLNDLEDRIEDAFDDVDTELDTKANEQDVTNLNNAINQLDHRLENIEQSKGDYIVSAYKDGSTTPSGKGKWAVVEGLRGVSRVENMLFKTSASKSRGGISCTNVDGTLTLSGVATSTYAEIFDTMQIVANHSYLVFFADVVNPNAISFNVGSLNTTVKSYLGTPKVVTSLSGRDNSGMGIESYTSGTNFNGISFKFFIRDLNVYFGTSDLSFLGATDSAKLATIQTNYPHLLLPSDYGTRIVDSSYVGVRAYSANMVNSDLLVDPSASVTKSGDVYSCSSAYNLYAYSSDNKVLKGNLKENTQYNISWKATCGSATNIGWHFHYTDGTSSSRLAVVNSTSETYATGYSAANKTIDYIYFNYGGGTTFSFSELMVNEGTTAMPYSPYGAIDTLSFPSTTLKSAGSVREKKLLNVEVEIDGQKVQKSVKTNPLGEQDLSQIAFTYNSSFASWRSNSAFSLAKPPASNGDVANIMLAGFVAIKGNDVASTAVMSIAMNIGGNIWVNNGSSTTPPSGTMRYELATPNPDTLSDPLIDNTLLTEGGGRMATVQTGTVVDGIADLGFITL